MIINVSEALLELIKQIEEREREDSGLNLDFGWSYYEDGLGAHGVSWFYNPHGEYDLRVSADGEQVDANRRELGKYDNEGWEMDEADSTYEEDEE